jgi:flagellar biosynthesis/type III secretory pathway protein FliH
MMAGRLRLETFELLDAGEEPRLMMPEDLEELRLAAYERGYGAGWDDAESRAANDLSARRLAAEAALERLNFTYHEASAQALSALTPLFEQMFETLLPQALRLAVIPAVIEHLLPLAREALAQPLRLQVPPGQMEVFEAAMSGLILPPLQLAENPALSPGQAVILGPASGELTQIDLASALAAMRMAFARFHPSAEQDVPHVASR